MLGLQVLLVLLVLLHERSSLLELAVVLGNCISEAWDKIFVLEVPGQNFIKRKKLSSCHVSFQLRPQIEWFLN